MTARFLFTGYPGFLGVRLLPRVLARSPEATALCVVQEKFMDSARARVDDLERKSPAIAERIELVPGDITVPGLGLAGSPDPVLADVTEVFHLAAIYDLSVEHNLAMRVNVEGTRNVLDVAARCPQLRRFHYVSTCYVSGAHPGVFREDDLEKDQAFHNHYERSKYLAEVEVRKRIQEGLPATIYRPSIVVGDSQTGETQKYDGPYFVIRWILKQRGRYALMPVVGRPNETVVNVIPRDFAVDAISFLAAQPEATGRTFALADPDPMTVAELLTALEAATGRRLVRIRMPLPVARWSLHHVPGLSRLMGIPAEAVDYFAHPTSHDVSNTTAAIRGSGVEVPSLRDYLPHLVAFVREHPDIPSAAMA